MDASEGNGYCSGTKKTEFPPLYGSVNTKEAEDGSRLCPRINRVLFPFKMFYFFFYGAIGSLYPFIALYFKHLWLSPTEAGFLVGLRPFVQTFSMPLWAIFADKCRLKKLVLLIGLCGWLFTHVSMLLVPPGEKPLSCNVNVTATSTEMKRYYHAQLDNISARIQRMKRNGENDVAGLQFQGSDWPKMNSVDDHTKPYEKHLTNPMLESSSTRLTQSPFIPRAAKPHSTEDGVETSIWTFTNRSTKTWKTFAYLCLIVVIGNLIAAPTQTMANAAMLQVLAADTHKYGMQRYFGSLGWGIAAFVIGMLVSLNHDSALICEGLDDINYSPCFYAFGIFMLLALVFALFFKIDDTQKYTKVEIGVCSKLRKELDYLTCFVLFTAFLAGFNMGFIQTFLFWYLQSIGGTQKLFSLMTGLNAVGEMIGFLLSVKLIDTFGHLKVLALGIAAYAVRLSVYGLVMNPWAMLSVEILKGFTSSGIWSSVISFIGESIESGSVLISLLHMLYWGVGYGGAGIIGGVLTEHFGAKIIFLSLAFISVLDILGILLVLNLNCCPKRTQNVYMPVISDEEEDEVPEAEQ